MSFQIIYIYVEHEKFRESINFFYDFEIFKIVHNFSLKLFSCDF